MKTWFRPVFAAWIVLGMSVSLGALAQTPEPPASRPFTVNVVYRSGGEGEVKTLKQGIDLASGDHYKIIFTPSEACYMYIFQIDSAQKAQRIFPMERYRDLVLNNVNPVQAGTTYYIPSQSHWLRLDQQTGVERIFLWTTFERDEQLEQLSERTKDAADESVTMELLAYADQVLTENPGTARGFDDIVEGETLAWQEEGETVPFSIVQGRLAELCDGCFYLLTFMHN